MKQKLFTFLCLCILCIGSAWGENKVLTFDLSSNPGKWPTANSTTVTDYNYVLNGTNYTFALKNVKCNSGYLMLTKTAALGLPAIEDYKLTKIVAKNSSGCSTSVKVGISSSASDALYISGGDAITWSNTSSTYTYNLSNTTNHTIYYVYVTSANAQITELTLTYEPMVKDKFTVTYYSLGKYVKDEEVYDGEFIANVPSVTVPTGWEFAGWTTNDAYETSTTAPTFFDKTTPVTANVDLCAVFKKTESCGVPANYIKITEEPSDWSGRYLIVFEGATVNSHEVAPNAFNGNLNTLDATSNYVKVTLNSGSISIDDNNKNAYFDITKASGGYSITSASGITIGNDNTTNALKTGTTLINTIALATGGNVTITSHGTTLQFNANSDQTRYRYYTSTNQKPIYLYKLEDFATTTYTITEPQSVTISSVGYSTYSSAYALVAPDKADAEIFGAKINDAGTDVTLIPVEAGTVIKAGEGIIVKGKAEANVEFYTSTNEGTEIAGNLLKGSLTGETFNETGYTYYILSTGKNGVGFYWDASTNDEGATAKCAQYKAVLAVPNTSAGAPSFFTFDDATAINGISSVKTSGVRYNLNGQAVGEDYKGIVIVNGKKMFNK